MVKEMIKDEPPNYVATAPTFIEFDAGAFHIEIVPDEPDIIFHLYKYKQNWPTNMKQRLIRLLDSRISDTYTLGYENIIDSWYIRIFKFYESRISPEKGAVELIKEIAMALSDDPRVQIPRGSK